MSVANLHEYAIAGNTTESRWGGVASGRRIGELQRIVGWPRPEPRESTEPVLALAAALAAEPPAPLQALVLTERRLRRVDTSQIPWKKD